MIAVHFDLFEAMMLYKKKIKSVFFSKEMKKTYMYIHESEGKSNSRRNTSEKNMLHAFIYFS